MFRTARYSHKCMTRALTSRIIKHVSICSLAKNTSLWMQAMISEPHMGVNATAYMIRPTNSAITGHWSQYRFYSDRSRYQSLYLEKRSLEWAFFSAVQEMRTNAMDLKREFSDELVAHLVHCFNMFHASLRTLLRLEDMGWVVGLHLKLNDEEMEVARSVLGDVKEMQFVEVNESREMNRLKHNVQNFVNHCHAAEEVKQEALDEFLDALEEMRSSVLRPHFDDMGRVLQALMEKHFNSEDISRLKLEPMQPIDLGFVIDEDRKKHLEREHYCLCLALRLVRHICNEFDLEDEEQLNTGKELLEEMQSHIPPDIWTQLQLKIEPKVMDVLRP